MAKKSVVVGVRLHPDDPRERDALKILDRLERQGYSKREIITDAILSADGRTPEMYKGAGETLTAGILQTLLEEFAKEIINSIGSAPAAGNDGRRRNPFGEHTDEDADYAKNIAASFLSRRGGK